MLCLFIVFFLNCQLYESTLKMNQDLRVLLLGFSLLILHDFCFLILFLWRKVLFKPQTTTNKQNETKPCEDRLLEKRTLLLGINE